MSEFRIDQITNQSGSRGPDIAGITTFSATSGMVMPSGPTEYRGGRGRGLFGGGGYPTITNVIEYITISTTSNAFDFGDFIPTQHKFFLHCEDYVPKVYISSNRRIPSSKITCKHYKGPSYEW